MIKIKYIIIFFSILFTAGCDSPQPQQLQPLITQSPTAQNSQPAASAPQSQSLTDHMITSAVGGAAAGAGAAVAHQASNGMMDKWRTYSRARRINKIRSRRR